MSARVEIALPTALAARAAALEQTLARVARDYAPAAFASSLSVEDMVITDVILDCGLDIEIFTLDTERLHQDTLDVIGAIERRYDRSIRVIRPDPRAVAEYVDSHGLDAFYQSVELRQRCCNIRKVEPLKRALAGKKAWLTGQRRAQSVTRAALPEQEHDAAHGIEKFNPLADWSEDEVWTYVRAREVPYNRLYDQGYRSIGCAPCTRPVTAGEDVRAGRWWWEQPGSRECGLNVGPDGRLVRAKTAGKVTA
ncbi:MAG TPA: phosphoadenylyl-sulfate reductase [Burkholderiales bacterium]|nr:phosphoadenylyl-sulfate reductase [Burkholderiales bacterium]